MEFLHNLDCQKEVIESADFFALNWKLDRIRVSMWATENGCTVQTQLKTPFYKFQYRTELYAMSGNEYEDETNGEFVGNVNWLLH